MVVHWCPYSRAKAWQSNCYYTGERLHLSGANWRGFNAKSLPISIYYAQIIAKYFREFHRLGLRELDLENLTPWFL